MTFDEFQELAARTDGQTDNRDRLMNCVLGLAGEAGEVVELLKKKMYHGKAVTIEQFVDEASDCLWYLAGLARSLGVSLDYVARHNVAKLQARYPDGFTKGGGKR